MGHLYAPPPKKQFRQEYPPLVSVIIPAHNEAVGIRKTIYSIIDSDYRNFEIIIIDDGSTDNTLEVANRVRESFGEEIIVIKSKSNRGKANALNTGIIRATGEIVITIDADSYVKPNTISELIKALNDPQYNVATGTIEVGNPKNLINFVQYFEYIFGFHFKKTQFLNNSLYIFPGAITAFRKKSIIEVGLFEDYSVTEDFDVSLKLINAGNKVVHVDKAVCITEGASTFKGLVNQRTRWRHGYFQCMRERRKSLERSKLGFYLYFIEIPLGILGVVELLLFPFLLILLISQIVIYSNPFVFLVNYLLLPIGCLLLISGKIKKDIKLLFIILFLPFIFSIANAVEFISLLKALFRFTFNKQTHWTKWNRVGI